VEKFFMPKTANEQVQHSIDWHRERAAALKEAAKPLVDFLYKYGNPHSSIIVSQRDTEFFSGEAVIQNDLRD